MIETNHSFGLKIYIPSATIPFNSCPSVHPNFSRSFFGIITKYFAYFLPLYPLLSCFDTFMYTKYKSSINNLCILNYRNLYILFPDYYMVRDMEGKEKIKAEKIRKMRAFAIISKGDMPERVKENVFVIPSQSEPDKTYTVWQENEEWKCDCPDHQTRNIRCKHIQAVDMWLTFEDNQDEDILTLKAEINHPQCPECGSYDVVKNGFRKTKCGKRQILMCKHCHHKFVIEPIKYRKGNTKLIALCMDLYFKGLSLRKIKDTIKQFYDIDLHHDTIRVWINTFMNKITEYVNKYNPDLGTMWNIDEQMVKSEGDWVYSWNVLDTKTRFLIANTVTKGRSIFETKKVMKKAWENAETRPDVIVTDKMKAYPSAIKDEFYGVTHIQAGIRDAINNNKLERYHGTWRERDKVMRGLKSDATAEEMLDHYRTYYNFIRGHSALNGKTPSEVANIDLDLGKNKWLGLLEQSLANPTGDTHASHL